MLALSSLHRSGRATVHRPWWLSRGALVVMLLLCACARSAMGEIIQGSTKVPSRSLDRPKGFMEFGFQRNGSASLFITALPSDQPLYLLICTELDQSKFAYAADDMCDSLEDTSSIMQCEVVQKFTDQLRLFYVIPNYGYYYFNLINCGEEEFVTVNVYATLLNPGNNHLTATLVPVSTMYAIMGVLWLIVTVIWGLHIVMWCSAAVGLHALMTGYPLLKMLCTWYALKYYSYCAEHGSLYAKTTAMYGSFIVFQILFNLLLMALSRGWGMYRPSLKHEKYSFFAILAGMTVVMLFRYLYDSESQILILMVALGIVAFRVIILVYVFMGVNNTIRHLEAAMLRSANSQDANVQVALIKRHRVYVRLKMIIITWIGLNTGAFFTNLILFEGEPSNWVDLMNSEFLDFILFALLACNFRLRPIADLYISRSTPHPSSSSSMRNSESEHSSFDRESVGNVEMVTLGRTHTSRDSDQSGDSRSDADMNIPPLSSAILPMSDDEAIMSDNEEEDEQSLIQKRK